MGSVVVVGSANVDHVVRVPHLPRPGETVLGTTYAQHMGGKGANQAVAAARLGADVRMIAAVGTDAAATLALESLEAEGVDCTSVTRLAGVSTGVAVITVDDHGENQIGLAPGANLQLDPSEVARGIAAARPAVVLTVLEVPTAAVVSAANAARDSGALMLLNAAPAQPLSDVLLATGPLIIVNEDERSVVAPSVAVLLERGAAGLIVTRGRHGALVTTSRGEVPLAGQRTDQVVDATGAGDAFSGALAALLAEGLELADAARMANVAAALSVRRAGARGGMPTRPELEAFLGRSPSG